MDSKCNNKRKNNIENTVNSLSYYYFSPHASKLEVS